MQIIFFWSISTHQLVNSLVGCNIPFLTFLQVMTFTCQCICHLHYFKYWSTWLDLMTFHTSPVHGIIVNKILIDKTSSSTRWDNMFVVWLINLLVIYDNLLHRKALYPTCWIKICSLITSSWADFVDSLSDTLHSCAIVIQHWGEWYCWQRYVAIIDCFCSVFIFFSYFMFIFI